MKVNDNFYKKLIEKSPTGYAYHRIICGGDGLPCDYEFIEVNAAFEAFTGLKACNIIGKKISEVLPDIKKNEFDWIHFYGEIAINGGEKELEQYSELLHRWYKVNAYSPEQYYFVAHFTDISVEKRQSSELNISQQRLANIIKNINAGTWDWNLQIGEIFFNKRTAEIIGRGLEEISPVSIRTWEKFIHPEDLAIFNNQLNKILTDKTDYFDAEMRLKHKGGNWVYVQNRGKVISWTSEGKPLFMSGTYSDITDRKQAEEALRLASLYSRNLIETSLDPLVTISAEGIITDVNSATEKVTGVSRQNLIGRDFVDFFTEPEVARAGYLKAFEQGQVINYPLAIRHTSGAVTDVLYNASVYRNEQGEVLGVFAAARDITDRKRSEEALRLSLKYRLMTENVIDMISRQSLNGKYTYLSPSCKRILGYEPEDLIGINPSDLFHPDNVELSRKSLKTKLKSADIDISTNRIRHKDNTYVWLETSKKIISDYVTGEPTEILCVSRDVTSKIEEENLFKRMVVFAEELLRTGPEQVTYSEILENLLYISKAKFGVITLLSENTGEFTIVASAGNKDKAKKTSKMLGFKLPEKVWSDYLIEKISNTQGVTILNVIVDNEIVGKFILLSSEGKYFENSYLVEIYTRQINMFISRIKAEEEIINLSYHDQLTRLYNRRFYEEELRRLDTERNFPMTIAMGDVNGLKLINDSFGHALGDELLRKVADVIKRGCRADDVVARLGGDEFVIVLPKTDALTADRVIKRIKDLSLKEKAGSIDISISFGHATKNSEKENIRDILKTAEDNMYRHKLSEGSSMRSKTIDLIMNALFEKNNGEKIHSKRVGQICKDIATSMDFNEDDVNQIRIAGLMHDIGKTSIVEHTFNKSGGISAVERKEIERHSEIGYRILSSVSEFSEIANYVLEHHEKYNGQGYPRGLKGEEISVQARIIAIADAYDTMTGVRTYGSNTFSEKEAIDEIRKCAGTQFDPNISKVFVEKVLGKDWK